MNRPKMVVSQREWELLSKHMSPEMVDMHFIKADPIPRPASSVAEQGPG